VEIVPSLGEALSAWGGRDRVSPIFEVETTAQVRQFEFSRKQAFLLFMGPVAPALADGCLPHLRSGRASAWLTFGLFNLVVYTASKSEAEKLTSWAVSHHVRWEKWLLHGHAVKSVRCSNRTMRRDTKPVLIAIQRFRAPASPPELRDAASEYCALIATAVCRASEVDSQLVDELELANTIILEAAAGLAAAGPQAAGKKTKKNLTGLRAVPLFVDANAALSRFASQAFSGMSPIRETECHFWTHSLLGTGISNLALTKIRRFITKTLGEARIPDQVELFKEVTDRSVLEQTLQDGRSMSEPWLQNLSSVIDRRPLLANLRPLAPLVTYLSGRDGFHTTQTSLSAPLNVLTSCSSLRWSLLTITHEMSHRVIDGVLSYVLPAGAAEVAIAVDLLNEKQPPANLLECLLFKIINAMADINTSRPVTVFPEEVTEQSLMDLINTRREEVEEVMVHVFDFIYFYGGLPEVYVPAIWRSWDAIPNLRRRLPYYVLRTLCAVYAKFWNSPKATQDAIAAVEAGMGAVAKSDKGNVCIHDGLEYLKREKEALQIQMDERLPLIGIVRTFLQSPEILQMVRGQADKSEAFRGLVFDGSPIENPLRFIEANTTSEANVLKAFWLLTRLAFDASEPEPTRLENVHP
jgi:hypothetical protein